MSDNFWERDYVIEHLRVCPGDYEFLQALHDDESIIFEHVVDFDDIEFNIYLDRRNRGQSHLETVTKIINWDRWCHGCDRIVTLQEHEDRTCYECSTKAALRG